MTTDELLDRILTDDRLLEGLLPPVEVCYAGGVVDTLLGGGSGMKGDRSVRKCIHGRTELQECSRCNNLPCGKTAVKRGCTCKDGRIPVQIEGEFYEVDKDCPVHGRLLEGRK